MKKILFTIFLLSSLIGFSQKFKTNSSHIRFFSDAPMEDIEAINESATSILDVASKAIVIVVPIKSFDFKKELMQEHFNENYLESDDFPNATFKGKLIDWDGSEGVSKVSATGTMEIHGVSKEMTITGDLDFSKNSLKLSTVFNIKLEDHKIKIPKAVFYKIAEEVEVTANFEYAPYEKN
ncbi:YceI family protein [Ekhidna sp. To15]|uniref:YceI family protein n=1 Tax=Ekhidna sp. To15 TaxID=3395267 RepID=UPI003F52051F